MSRRNCHANLAPTCSINVGAGPLRNLASFSYHPLFTRTKNFRSNPKFLPEPKITQTQNFTRNQNFHPNLKFSPKPKIFARSYFHPNPKCKCNRLSVKPFIATALFWGYSGATNEIKKNDFNGYKIILNVL